MANSSTSSGAPKAKDWLFESIVSASRENNRNLIWVCGAFLVCSFITVAINLGAIEGVEFSAFSVQTSLTTLWPIRTMLCVACLVAFAAVVYVVIEQIRLEIGLNFLASHQHEEAAMMESFESYLIAERPRLARAKTYAIAAFVIFCAVILVIDFATLISSFNT